MSSRTLDDDDFDAWFQAIMDEPVAEHPQDAARLKGGRGDSTLPSPETRGRPLGQTGVKTVGDPMLSFDDVINALGELFSDPKATEPEFSDEIYARARPLFEAAIVLLIVEKKREERAWRIGGCAKTMPPQSHPPRSRASFVQYFWQAPRKAS